MFGPKDQEADAEDDAQVEATEIYMEQVYGDDYGHDETDPNANPPD